MPPPFDTDTQERLEQYQRTLRYRRQLYQEFLYLLSQEELLRALQASYAVPAPQPPPLQRLWRLLLDFLRSKRLLFRERQETDETPVEPCWQSTSARTTKPVPKVIVLFPPTKRRLSDGTTGPTKSEHSP